MNVTVELHNGQTHTYRDASRVKENGQYKIHVYDAQNNILAVLNTGDVKNLLTDEAPNE
jgi:hypothetical protein